MANRFRLFGRLVLVILLLLAAEEGISVLAQADKKPAAKPLQQSGKSSVKKAGSQAARDIARGKALYKAQDCAACHKIAGQGCPEGVALDGIGKRRSAKFLLDHLKDPDEHVSKNKAAFGGDPVNLMPTPDLEKEEIALIVKYLQSLR